MSLADWSFLRPWWLLGLLPVLGLFAAAWLGRDRADAGLLRAVDAHLLPHLLSDGGGGRRGLLLAGGLAAAVLGVLALAGPVPARVPAAVPAGEPPLARPDVARVLVLDLSRPLAEPRLAAWRVKLQDLLQASPGGETALVAFAGEPYLIAPLTTDVATLDHFLPALRGDVLPVAGARPELAVAMVAKLLARNRARLQEVLWVSPALDEPSPALVDAVASLGRARLTVWHDQGRASPAWHALARRHGGEVTAMRADAGDVARIAGAWELRAEEGRTRSSRERAAGADVGPWLILLLLPLAALAFRRGLLACLLGLSLAGLPPAEAVAGPAGWSAAWGDLRGWWHYQMGDMGAAAASFVDPRWRAAASYRQGNFATAAQGLRGLGDAASLYNRGNALARSGRLAEALVAYEEALRLAPEDADARHNRDLVARLLRQPPSAADAGAGGGRGGQGGPGSGPESADRPRTDAEAARVAAQWLRQVPDDPAALLRARLRVEQRRRESGEVPPPW